jgi:hypothetical protein
MIGDLVSKPFKRLCLNSSDTGLKPGVNENAYVIFDK